jgi:hypothetical protein
VSLGALVALLGAAGCRDWQALSSDYPPDAPVCAFGSAAASMCPSGAVVCDGFETASLAPEWKNVSMNATISLDTSCAYRGSQSLRVQSDPVPSAGTARGTIVDDDASVVLSDYYVRAFVWWTGPASANSIRLIDIIQSSQPGHGILLAVQNGGFNIHNTIISADTANMVPLPTDRWTCLQLEVHVGNSGAVKLWIDGSTTPAISMVGIQTMPTPPAAPLGQVNVGLGIYGTDTAQPAIDLHVDEVVIATSPVGCDQ